MKIGIDARFLTHPQKGGFKTYTENLVKGLAHVDSENEYVLYLDRPPQEQHQIPSRPNFSTCIVSNGLPLIGMPWREQVGLTRQVACDRLDLFHSPCLTAPFSLACPLAVTIHDMIWFFPEKFSTGQPWSIQRGLMQWYYRIVTQRAVRNASAILTVSQAAKDSIVQHLKLDGKAIFVIHEAANSIYRQIGDARQIEKIRHQYQLPGEFVLAIGSADPRKNIAALLRAYALLPVALRKQYNLAVVWTHHFLETELAKLVEELGLARCVQFLHQVSNEDLVLLYNAASLFAFPSLYEGFGLTLLEAMACGTPVVAANNSSIPEIVGDAALLIEAQDVKAIADAMTRVLTDDTVQTNLIKKGLERSANFSWEKCARQTIDAYRFALDGAST